MIALSSIALLFGSQVAFAESAKDLSDGESKDLEHEINELMKQELEGTVEIGSDANVVFEDVSIDLDQSTLEEYDYDKEKIFKLFQEHADEIKNGFDIEVLEIEAPEANEDEIGTQSIVKKRGYYIAKVWMGVPAIGHGYVNQDFNATKGSNNRITNLKLLGSSYATGITLGGWTHNRSWTEVRHSTADIRMKGVIHYVFKGSPIRISATFKKTFKRSDL